MMMSVHFTATKLSYWIESPVAMFSTNFAYFDKWIFKVIINGAKQMWSKYNVDNCSEANNCICVHHSEKQFINHVVDLKFKFTHLV